MICVASSVHSLASSLPEQIQRGQVHVFLAWTVEDFAHKRSALTKDVLYLTHHFLFIGILDWSGAG